MSLIIVTGSAGLIGSQAVRFFADKGFDVIGIDNDMRKTFFGDDASTHWNLKKLQQDIPTYRHHTVDIRDRNEIEKIFRDHGKSIAGVIHAAAQPSHDWATRDPHTDFSVNANGTLTILEATRQFCPDAVFIFTSTNKVYGDVPNELPLAELEKRWEVDAKHPFTQHGIDETMRIDQAKHSIFGVSKVAADVLVQEYGKYFGMKTVCFRCGCLTGPDHCGAQLHGFLSYLVKCAVTGQQYTVLGYKGKQVRDNLHSYDLVNMFWNFFNAPRSGEVYNAGGSRHSNCSILEAIEICDKLIGKPMVWSYSDTNRIGDHIWYISDVRKFRQHYPQWQYKYSTAEILLQIFEATEERSFRL